MSAYLHGQPSLRAVFFRLQVVLHEQDCIQIKTIREWNALPEKIVEADSLARFQSGMRDYLDSD